MKLADKTCTEFIEVLASKAAVPGGGGAAALTGAIGMALGSMVCNLTIGKKKFVEYEEKLQGILNRAGELQQELLKMIDADAECFLPLSKAYGMPKDTDEQKKLKEETLEKCLKDACEVPVSIVKLAYESIKLHEGLVDNCSMLAISDVGVGVQCLRAAIIGAQLNVIININSIKDVDYVEKVKKETEPLIEEGVKLCDEVYEKVVKALSK
ncbi:cyclodeaminase/cyclohydrolase family protein [Clostridium sp. CX1]|uniref:Cyclodeaminase/cyclohydrolase family protein n=1 Tax=Clostridium tanneri TaxID=3037988 RepID=A0ABU4JPE0_9CLOT|nr:MULTISPECIES: cyclodeaminase/cyclohydrolase family protein [unclassified Clostridium]MCT8976363.1 cyclodeaminase/cyclohydrolase family protein [Clostridium sp. CX1]MDW8800027.1 cyclodeaminase/cyclohydrolase family protein [Clostridium sp. A1-XYC3]